MKKIEGKPGRESSSVRGRTRGDLPRMLEDSHAGWERLMPEDFCTIEEALAELRAGRMIVLVDDENRENEGDLVLPAEKVTPEAINFMLTHARGLLCLAMSPDICDRLHLPPQTHVNTARMGTAFTVKFDARTGISTGTSASDRAR